MNSSKETLPAVSEKDVTRQAPRKRAIRPIYGFTIQRQIGYTVYDPKNKWYGSFRTLRAARQEILQLETKREARWKI